MLKNPRDRRAQRTAQQIKEAMLLSMEKKTIHEISVAELCRSCGINRATFYDHFRDIFDLVESIEGDILAEFQLLIENISETSKSTEVSERFFAFWDQHRRILKLLLTKERSREFTRRMNALIMPYFEQQARKQYLIPTEQEGLLQQALQFITSGYYHFYMQILENPEKAQVDARLSARMSDACLGALFFRREYFP